MTKPADGQSADRASYELAELVATARALSSERDINKLLAVILREVPPGHRRRRRAASTWSRRRARARRSTGAPPKKRLHFMLSQNDSIAIDFKDFKLAIDDKSIVGQAVLAQAADQHPGPDALAPSTGKTPALRPQPQLRREDRLPRPGRCWRCR